MDRSGEPTLRLVIFDLDGVIYRGQQPVPGAAELVAALRDTAILERAGVGADEAIAIGDNPDADMVAAHRAGMQSILVLTGVADAALAATLEGERRPDQVARDPSEVAALLRRRLS